MMHYRRTTMARAMLNVAVARSGGTNMVHCMILLPREDGGLPSAGELRSLGFRLSDAVGAARPASEPEPGRERPPDSGPEALRAAANRERTEIDEILSID